MSDWHSFFIWQVLPNSFSLIKEKINLLNIIKSTGMNLNRSARLFLFITGWFILLNDHALGQIPVNTDRNYTELKYSISFADQCQLAYDGSKLKVYINQSFFGSGDVAFFNGKYFNAISRYYSGLPFFPLRTDVEGKNVWGIYSLMMNVIDTSKMDQATMKMFTSGVNTVGLLYQTRGKFTRARELLNLSMQARAAKFGRTSREYISSLHNLAVLKKDLGQYDEAEKIFNYILPTFKKLFTDRSFQYVIALNNKGMLLAELGRRKEALQLLDEALERGKEALSPEYFDYERILTNRALLAQEGGSMEEAEKFYQQALSGMETKGFEDHPDYNNVLVYYGSFLVQKNNPDLSDYLDKVANKVKQRYNNEHPTYAKALENKGDYLIRQNRFQDARDVFEKVVSIRQSVLGEKHKDYLGALIKLAVCNEQLGDNTRAAEAYTKAINGFIFLADGFFNTMSEPEKSVFWNSLKPNLDAYLSFVIHTANGNQSLLKDAYKIWLKTKGMIIQSTRKTREAILNGTDTATQRLFNNWLDLKNELASYYSSPLEDLKEDKLDLTEMERRANAMEKELSRRSAVFTTGYLQQETGFDQVRTKLNEGEAVVEVMRVMNEYGSNKGEPEYAAFVFRNNSQAPGLVRLLKGAALEKQAPKTYRISVLKNLPDNRSYPDLWQPLEKELGDSRTIYFSADGMYNTINLNTLQRGDSSYLLDRYKLVYISSSKILANGFNAAEPGNSNAVLLGSPVFGEGSLVPPLPGTLAEVNEIGIVLNTQMLIRIYMELEATEENIKNVKRPGLLHMATHGFFYSNPEYIRTGIQVSKAKDNILLRSGLYLNGSGAANKTELELGNKNDGVLYAYEAMNLDLQGTGMVVLSACETGLGEIVNGEGVYGLCRAFQVAGAKKIIMSLWKVDDQATRLLMKKFYEYWIQSKDAQEAFIRAQKATRIQYPQSNYWGAFVLLN